MPNVRNKSGVEMRAAACAQGLPPMVALATQISTSIYGNMVAFRGSGPISKGLYRDIFIGEARPKPVTEKAKSSNIGPQNGRAVADTRNGRYVIKEKKANDEKVGEIEYELRKDTPPKGLDAKPLEVSLKNILSDLGVNDPPNTKYQLVADGKNPDDAGILRFYENHPSLDVRKIVYSININEVQKAKPVNEEEKLKAEKLKQAIIDNYKLVSNHLESQQKRGMLDDERFKDHFSKFDDLYTVFVKHPEDEKPSEIMVLGGIVRDCDIDFMTDPPAAKMESLLSTKFGKKDFKKFLEPLDMSPHLHSEKHSQLAENMERIRARNARDDMVDRLIEINKLRWEKYNDAKDAAKGKAGFNLAEWELANAHLRPFVPEKNIELFSAMVVTVGKGTPMQLYQALEINILQQKILASRMSENVVEKVEMDNLDSPDKNIRNIELLKLHKQPISYSKETIACCFIQHPSECHNEYYTSPRETSVLVKDDVIKMGEDEVMTNIVQNSKQYIPINKQWINTSAGDTKAPVWVEHFLRNEEMYREKQDVIDAVNRFLKNDNNIPFIVKLQNDFVIHPGKPGTPTAAKYVNKFLKENPDVRNKVEDSRQKVGRNQKPAQNDTGIEQSHVKIKSRS